MTPRPLPVKSRHSRPLSAIFIGSSSSSNSTPPSIPDLPEPPSPSSSSASGLPSPPATNSTGSDSVGDRTTSSVGRPREHSPTRSRAAADMVRGEHDRARSRSGRSRAAGPDDDDDDDVFENENEENDTARLSGRRPSKSASADNMSTLQRVKDLTQRNRMVLDKLHSITRLSSPATPNTRSPLSPPSANTHASSFTSRRASSSYPRPPSTNGFAATRRLDSGSETERESQKRSSYAYSSDDNTSATPPAIPLQRQSSAALRERRPSAPATPSKSRPTHDRERGSPCTPQKRSSMAMSVDETHTGRWREQEQDVSAAALAAAASARRSPIGTNGTSRQSRQLLPREFTQGERQPVDKVNSEPSTPYRHTERHSSSARSPGASISTNVQTSPRRTGASRSSTMRDLARKHQTRRLSEDLSVGNEEASSPTPATVNGSNLGRHQADRSGSSDATLVSTGGRSLLSEGLRTAGLSKRREARDDVFANGSGASPVTQSMWRPKSTSSTSIHNGQREDERTNGTRPSTRVSEGVGPPSSYRHGLRTPASTSSQRYVDRNGIPVRPGTSMAALHSPDPPRAILPTTHTHTSSHPLQSRDGAGSRQAQHEPAQPADDRLYSSSYATGRSSTVPPIPGSVGRDSNAEHRRLMLEALGVFESHLSRLPPMGQTTTNTIPELFQITQHLVHSMDRLNGALRERAHNALQTQIEAEVADSPGEVGLAAFWEQIGSEHRDSLRISDEVVRNMTGFLLAVGKLLRESNTSPPQHLRTVSLDDETTKRISPEVSGNRTVDSGRSSERNRRSWDAKDARTLRTSLERTGGAPRPVSSLNILRPGTPSSGGGSVDATHEQTPPAARSTTNLHLPPSTSRRLLFTTRRGTAEHTSVPAPTNTAFISHDTGHEPSPTPTSRYSHSTLSERPRAAVPPSLSTLPSESLLSRSNTVPIDMPDRRKISSNSNVTARAEPPSIASVVKPSNATIALTRTTVSNASDSHYPLTRSGSTSSCRTNGITFSRPATESMSTLSGLQQHDRDARTRTSSTSSVAEDPVYLAPAAVCTPLSGERDNRRSLGSRSRMSRDSAFEEEAASASSRPSSHLPSSLHRERRRTIAEVFTHR